MAYIWQNYKKDNYYYIPKKKQSYYEEIWKKTEKYIPVNIFNRFTDIFFPVSVENDPNGLREMELRYKKDSKFKNIVNLVLHQLTIWDRCKGITLEDVIMSLLYDDICNGMYGENVRKGITLLEFDDLYIILKELTKHSMEKNIKVLLDETLHLLFGKVFIYKEKSTGNTMIYIEQIRNKYREHLYNMVIYLFADMELKIECFWANEHFGIIGNDSTMHIGKIRIYV